MIEGIQNLLALQQLDDVLIACRQEHESIPAQREALAKERESADASLAEAREAATAAEASQREAETKLQDQEALLHKLEGQQNQVKTNEAYTALLHEMDAAREAISECETRILEAMDRIEAARAALTEVEERVRQTHRESDAAESALAEREVELEREIARLSSERETICAAIEPDVLSRYSKVAARRRPAVVLISKETCEGCRVDIPPQRYIEILRGERLISCEHCQRVLVHRDAVGEAPA